MASTERLFRHKTIRRFCVSEFEFNDFELRLIDDEKGTADEKAAKFIAIIKTLPRRDSLQIVEINSTAVAESEKAVVDIKTDTVVRGPMQAGDILTDADKQRLATQQGTGSTQPGATNPTAAGNNLAGMLGNLK